MSGKTENLNPSKVLHNVVSSLLSAGEQQYECLLKLTHTEKTAVVVLMVVAQVVAIYESYAIADNHDLTREFYDTVNELAPGFREKYGDAGLLGMCRETVLDSESLSENLTNPETHRRQVPADHIVCLANQIEKMRVALAELTGIQFPAPPVPYLYQPDDD